MEKIRLAYQDYGLGQYTNPVYTFQDALNSIFGTGTVTALATNSNGAYTINFSNGKKYIYTIETGKIEEVPKIQIIICEECSGTGIINEKCQKCDGKGSYLSKQEVTCSECEGTGGDSFYRSMLCL